MKSIHASDEKNIAAPPDLIYRYLADYRNHHFKILPAAFTDAAVEEGGVGAGTVIRARVRLGGKAHFFRARVEEPEPGKVLMETDLRNGAVTTFTLTPKGSGTSVRIETRFPRSPGIRGLVESLLVPGMLRRLYRDELTNLETYARRAS